MALNTMRRDFVICISSPLLTNKYEPFACIHNTGATHASTTLHSQVRRCRNHDGIPPELNTTVIPWQPYRHIWLINCWGQTFAYHLGVGHENRDRGTATLLGRLDFPTYVCIYACSLTEYASDDDTPQACNVMTGVDSCRPAGALHDEQVISVEKVH